MPYIDPLLVLNLVGDLEGTVLLASTMLHQHYGRYSFICLNPLEIYSGNKIIDVIEKWQQLFATNCYQFDASLPPFIGGLVGYLSYDLSKELEPSIVAQVYNKPDFFQLDFEYALYNFGLYNQVIAFDHYYNTCYLLVCAIAGKNLNLHEQLDALYQIYNTAVLSQANVTKTSNTSALSLQLTSLLKSNFTEQQYIKMVDRAIKYITDGDIFEVNLAQKYIATVTTDFFASSLFARLAIMSPAPFAAYLNFNDLVIISNSPERFISVRENSLEARPIKGTIRRGKHQQEDDSLKQQLLASIKDRAENIMIVDLMRNDFAKICLPHSVKVNQLCGIETFANVHHLVSVIEGKLQADKDIFAIISACFPGGSITGAPKVRSMQIIEELETTNRGIYCGSIGYFSFNGSVDLSIAIRTIVVHKNQVSFSVGGAVTLNSDPIAEYKESLIKGQKLMEALNGCNN